MSTVGLGDVETQVRAAIDAEPIGPRDQGAVALAIAYAKEIDLGGDTSKLGPGLLACLEALGLTPRARKAVKTDGQQPAANPLDELRARRGRKSRPADRDATAP